MLSKKPQDPEITQRILARIIREVTPDHMNVHEEMGSVCLVGQKAMKQLGSVVQRAIETLETEEISIENVSAPQGGVGILLGVNSDKTKRAVRALYKTFIEK